MSVCSSCYQLYNLMIRFECNHLLCIHCFQSLPNTSLPVKCVSCSKPTQTFRYKFQKVLSCDLCDQQKPVDEFWWCDDCFTTVCSSCAMRAHKGCDTTNWDDMRIWKVFVEETENRLDHLVKLEKLKIDDFLDKVRSHLYTQIEKSAKLAREVLVKDDDLVTRTFDIKEQANMESRKGNAKNEITIEARRLLMKTQLKQLLDNLRIGGKQITFDLTLNRFISPDPSCLDGRLQEMSIDGVVPKA